VAWPGSTLQGNFAVKYFIESFCRKEREGKISRHAAVAEEATILNLEELSFVGWHLRGGRGLRRGGREGSYKKKARDGEEAAKFVVRGVPSRRWKKGRL